MSPWLDLGMMHFGERVFDSDSEMKDVIVPPLDFFRLVDVRRRSRASGRSHAGIDAIDPPWSRH
jgi:hypothetical protein